MTPTEAIAALDRQIAAHGQSISFRRGADTAAMTAFVRGYRPEQLVGLITQADRQVALSPSHLGAFGVPKEQDDVQINGEFGKVQPGVEQVHIGDTLVRVNLRVTMA